MYHKNNRQINTHCSLFICNMDRFDPHFNAIIGLIGSRKWNVYKQRQAGITKARVTVVFDNSDVTVNPVGYEQCPEMTITRQVILGGKSK